MLAKATSCPGVVLFFEQKERLGSTRVPICRIGGGNHSADSAATWRDISGQKGLAIR